MTRGEMRTMLRRRVDDKLSRRWTDADCDDELNASAQYVGSIMSRKQGPNNYFRGTLVCTMNGAQKEFTTGDSAFVRVYQAKRTDPELPEPCRLIDQREEADYAGGDGYDDDGRLVFYVGWSAATPPVALIGFPVAHPTGVIVTAYYVKKVAVIATGAPGDASSFALPDQEGIHELVVQDSVCNLLGHDLPTTSPAWIKREQLLNNLTASLGFRGAATDIRQVE